MNVSPAPLHLLLLLVLTFAAIGCSPGNPYATICAAMLDASAAIDSVNSAVVEDDGPEASRLAALAAVQARSADQTLQSVDDEFIRAGEVWIAVDAAVQDVNRALEALDSGADDDVARAFLISAGLHLESTLDVLPPGCLEP